ncbi:MAG: SWIM zinc finger family protein [Deltaproteobacteria bacterium]|nr:SWIM zinc finger family protein [Deltaproteobacteria bacterium]
MKVDFRYLGRSEVREIAGGQALSFAPNLARSKVFFDAEIVHPLRFREAICALHDVVVGDLKFKKKDKGAYEAWKRDQAQKQEQVRQTLLDQARMRELAAVVKEPLPKNLKGDFQRMHRLYWDARNKWALELSRNDPELFRHLVPCDPVVTVAPDMVFFECFAKDESSYGFLGVDRGAFRTEAGAGLGTTNVDYSLALYEHFQTLRSYRPTRLLVDPSGFEVNIQGRTDYREEKIDLPASWLRGFGQLQAAMGLPSRRFELSVDVVYSILAFLKRHREKAGPRSLRFQLQPGKPPTVVLEPWGIPIVSHGRAYEGEKAEEIKVWGRRRLAPLARILPLAERFEVMLFGSGLPSVWTARMGEMRMVLALSGWTANDWTRGSNLDQFFADLQADPAAVDKLAGHLEQVRMARLTTLAEQTNVPRSVLMGSLHELARRGQLVYDFSVDAVRWRSILPVALSESMLGPEPAELVAGRRLAADPSTTVEREVMMARGARLVVANVGQSACEAVIDPDGSLTRAKCGCSFFYKNKLRAGPCRHLIALRSVARRSVVATTDRSDLTVHLMSGTYAELRAEADKRTVATGYVIEHAWRLAREAIQRTASLADPTQAAGVYRTPAKIPQSLSLPRALVEEIQREAARLDVSVSVVVEAAWSVAADQIRKSSSLLN